MQRTLRIHRVRAAAAATVATVLVVVAAGGGGGSSSKGVTITLVTHDSFTPSKSVMRAFTKQIGGKVKVLKSGDAGAALNQAILTKSHPLGDAFFGVDNTFLSRALGAGIFAPYRAAGLDSVPSRFQLDATHRLTPVDYGDVCVNFDKKWFADHHLAVPQTLDDLAKPEYKGLLVTENPATSSPGLAFLLATVAHFGPNGWRDYWTRLRADDVRVEAGWEQAYSTDFSGSTGKGSYPLVVSYASSPPAEVSLADPKPSDAPTGALLDTCFRQVELVGVLKGTKHAAAARQLVDFMLSTRFQEDLPLSMFVFPVREGAKLPDVFVKYAQVAPRPFELPPAEIGAQRDRWIDQWTATVLR